MGYVTKIFYTLGQVDRAQYRKANISTKSYSERCLRLHIKRHDTAIGYYHLT